MTRQRPRILIAVVAALTVGACRDDLDRVVGPKTPATPTNPAEAPRPPDPLPPLGPPRHLFLYSTGLTMWPAGTPVHVYVNVRDSSYREIPNVVVDLELVSGDGQLELPSARTGGDGIARIGRWTLGEIPSVNVLRARVGAVEPLLWT
ncbi:MAG: hypothetical protein ABMA00_20480, partial [Gemmatimonas sp.]